MREIVFCQTRWHYKTYEDYFALARLSGYPIIYVDELDPADDSKVYVVTPLNGEWNQGWENPRARIIHHDLEWRHQHDYPHIPGVVETWASDAWYAMQVGARYVTLGSHSDLPLHPLPEKPEPPKWDVAFLAYMNPRRAMIAAQLQQMGITVAPNGWNEERHQILTHVRAMVHVHQWDEFKCIAPQRWAVAAAYKLPIFTEQTYSAAHSMGGVYGYGEFASAVKNYLQTQSVYLAQDGQQLYDYLCIERPFRHGVDAAVEALGRFGVV